MKASLIWDHKGTLNIPEEMGAPKEGQLRGTITENLCELGGRICYDSLGTGRDTDSFHKHLVEVAHWSVYEHARLELGFSFPSYEKHDKLIRVCLWLVGQPGIEIRYNDYWGAILQKNVCADLGSNDLVVNINLRHLLDWHKNLNKMTLMQQGVYNAFLDLAKVTAPRVVAHCEKRNAEHNQIDTFQSNRCEYRTLFLRGSRGFSHEMVRHRYSMSQRSTRFCDETDSEWINHPMLVKYFDQMINTPNGPERIVNEASRVKDVCKNFYGEVVTQIQSRLEAEGADKQTARKQARGAARGYLGNALATELVFTAPLSGWHDMIRQRYNPAADWEIKEIFSQVNLIING